MVLSLTNRKDANMFKEKRPTSVTVISWVWIALGVMMTLSATMALLGFLLVGNQTSQIDNLPLLFKYFPYFAAIQVVLAITGVVAGINFLKLKRWSRDVLEVLTWLLLIFIVGFSFYWSSQWLTMTSGVKENGFQLMGLITGMVVCVVYAIPLFFMLRALRSTRVRNAVSHEPNAVDSERPTPQ